MLALALLAAVGSPWAAARDAGLRQVTSSERPARDSRPPDRTRKELTCPGLAARDIAELRDIPEIDIDELCRAAAEAAKDTDDESSFPVPLWLLVVSAVVAIAFSAAILWYSITRDVEVPRPWRWW